MSFRTLIAAAAVIAVTTGCTINRPTSDDYRQYLANNQGVAKLPAAKAGEQYYLTPATQAHHYEFRSATAGYANVWVVDFGKVLDATMQSPDVIAALGNIKKASDDKAASGNTIVFDLQNYAFKDHGAHVELAIAIRNAQGEVFRKVYKADGDTQGAKMFFAGAFGMKNAVQQSTKLAVDSILTRFLNDVNNTPALSAAR
jgi:hypothetical protein